MRRGGALGLCLSLSYLLSISNLSINLTDGRDDQIEIFR
jgi:hypothetical protein